MTAPDTTAIRALAAECKAAGDRAHVQIGAGQYMRVLWRAEDALTALCDALDEAQGERMEQARLLGMSAERELSLRAERDLRDTQAASLDALNKRLQAENERLRADAARIADDFHPDRPEDNAAALAEMREAIAALSQSEARAALSPAEGQNEGDA